MLIFSNLEDFYSSFFHKKTVVSLTIVLVSHFDKPFFLVEEVYSAELLFRDSEEALDLGDFLGWVEVVTLSEFSFLGFNFLTIIECKSKFCAVIPIHLCDG